MALTMFTMNADAANLVASDTIAGLAGLKIHFDLNANSEEWLRVTGGARPVLLTYKRITGYIRSDGRMYDRPATSPAPYDLNDAGELGVRLPANDPNLNLLNDVSYYVSWEAEIDGQEASFYPFNTPAVPSTDTMVDLGSFAPGPGHTVVGIPALGLVDDLGDMSGVGKQVARASSKAAARAAIDAITAADVDAEAITDASDLGRELITAADDTTARNTIYAGMAQRARYGSKTVMDGDSIAAGDSVESAWNQSMGGWIQELCQRSGGRIDLVHNASVPSTGIDERLANFDDDVAAYSPETVILANGTNNVAGMSLNTYLTKLGQYYDKVRGIGAQLILVGIYPKSSTASTISTWNAALVDWGRPRGVLVIPVWELADTAAGAWPAAWTADGVHPLYTSGAYVELGKLAWQTLSRAFTEPVAGTARYIGEGIYSNFFTDLTATITGVATITGLAATTGTLPAGTYDYRVVAANYYGNGLSPADSSITLSSTGGVTITSGASGSYVARRVYRRGPTDAQYRYIGKISGTGSQTFTDTGITGLYDWFDGDCSRYPTGMLNSSFADIHTLAYGPPIQTDPDIRGNFLRLTRQEGSANLRSERFPITGLAEGQQIKITAKVRGTNQVDGAGESIKMRFFDPGVTTQIDGPNVFAHRLSPEWGLVSGRFYVPTGSDRVYVALEGFATSPYMDVAELRVA